MPSPPPGLPEPPEPHPDLEPVRFLLGRWEGAGVGGYPTIESFRFGQEITFSHNGKPFLIYASRTWLLDEDGNLIRPRGHRDRLLAARSRTARSRSCWPTRPGSPRSTSARSPAPRSR